MTRATREGITIVVLYVLVIALAFANGIRHGIVVTATLAIFTALVVILAPRFPNRRPGVLGFVLGAALCVPMLGVLYLVDV